MLDRERVLGKLRELDGYIGQIRELTPSSPDAYKADFGRRLACERLLHIGIECLLDVAELFVAGLRLGLPSRESGVIRQLREHGILPPEDLELLRKLQGSRNVLVHQYGKPDNELVYADLSTCSP